MVCKHGVVDWGLRCGDRGTYKDRLGLLTSRYLLHLDWLGSIYAQHRSEDAWNRQIRDTT